MNYQVMFYVGMVLTIIILIITIIAFFKCNVFEIICDLLGIKRNRKSGVTRTVKKSEARVQVKKVDEDQIESKKPLIEEKITRNYVVDKPIKEEVEVGTELLNDEGTQLLEEESVDSQNDNGDETSLLDDEDRNPQDNVDETSLLEEDETSLLDECETSLLEEYEDGFSEAFTKEIDISVIHTEMVI